MQRFPFSIVCFFLWFAHLAQFCIFASSIVFCSCQFMKSNSIFELSFLFSDRCPLDNSLQCSSASFVVDPEWHFISCLLSFVIFFAVLFPFCLFLLASHKTHLPFFKLRFPFFSLSGIKLFISFLNGKKSWWQHVFMQPISVLLYHLIKYCMLTCVTFLKLLSPCGIVYVNWQYSLNS